MSWTDTPTTKQADLIRKLGGDPAMCATRRDASDLIGTLQQQRPRATIDPDVTVGVYELADGSIYIVKPTRKREGEERHLYAKRLTETGGTRLTEAGIEVPEIDFEFERGAMMKIKATDKMDVERAKALTARYSRCIVCGAWLSAAESVERGIGPVCIKSFRGPLPTEISGTNALGETWEDEAGRPVAVAPAPVAVEHEIDSEARVARKTISDALAWYCREGDVSDEDVLHALRTFDRLVEGFER